MSGGGVRAEAATGDDRRACDAGCCISRRHDAGLLQYSTTQQLMNRQSSELHEVRRMLFEHQADLIQGAANAHKIERSVGLLALCSLTRPLTRIP